VKPVTEAITWIPVSDRMPEPDVTVLLYAPDAGEPVWPGFLDSDEDAGLSSPRQVWLWADATAVAERVTHWAHLPAGPGGGS
jgi:hypothetical protein